MAVVLSLLIALGFAAIHMLIGTIHFLDVVPRSRWLSFAGGIAVAYVFLHLLPELSAYRASLEGESPFAAEQSTFLIALAGLAAFYGLERAMKTANAEAGDNQAGPFWLHVASFAGYNLLIGYLLLHREESGTASLILFGAAMGFHFITNDFGLRQDYRERYDRTARWLLAGSVLVGWAMGLMTTISDAAIAVLFAFLAGGIILNVLKEELPEDRKSRFLPFAAGAALYSVILLLVPG